MRQHRNARTGCGLPIPSYLGMKVRSFLVNKWLVYMHEIVHIAYACK